MDNSDILDNTDLKELHKKRINQDMINIKKKNQFKIFYAIGMLILIMILIVMTYFIMILFSTIDNLKKDLNIYKKIQLELNQVIENDILIISMETSIIKNDIDKLKYDINTFKNETRFSISEHFTEIENLQKKITTIKIDVESIEAKQKIPFYNVNLKREAKNLSLPIEKFEKIVTHKISDINTRSAIINLQNNMNKKYKGFRAKIDRFEKITNITLTEIEIYNQCCKKITLKMTEFDKLIKKISNEQKNKTDKNIL